MIWRPVQQHLLSVLLIALLYCSTANAVCPGTYNSQTLVSCLDSEQVPNEVNQHILMLIESEIERDDCTSPLPLTSSPSVPKDTTPPPTELTPSTESPSVPKDTTPPPTELTPSTESPTPEATTTTEPTLPPGNGTLQNPASSCKYVPAGSQSGYYWISGFQSATQQYCDMSRSCCGSTGGWMRVVNINMTNPNQQCPTGFNTQTERRSCGRGTTGDVGCLSTTFPVNGVEYSKVCGRIIGYQSGTTDAFDPYINNFRGIDEGYVDGISLTHGRSPRNHIWTFAAALQENTDLPDAVCPCISLNIAFTRPPIPPFVGQDYFCDTGDYVTTNTYGFCAGDPLWDGQGCSLSSTCCTFNNPPWFCKQLPQSTRDDIELRLCRTVSFEDSPFGLVEIYVQ